MEFIFRGGLAVAVPVDYATQPAHVAVVDALTRARRYADAVQVLEQNSGGWLAADILSGAPWARRYLNTTARLWRQDRKLAQRGLRALMLVLSGTRSKVGRSKEPPLSPESLGRAGVALARWRADVDAVWHLDRASLVPALLDRAGQHFRVSVAHRRALKALSRRKRLRRQDLILTLVSWETGIPARRLRHASPVADLVYA